MGRSLVMTVIIATTSVALGGRAVAEPLAGRPDPPDHHPVELLIGLAQLAAGGAITVGAAFELGRHDNTIGAWWVLATPALVGGTVCAIGNLSRDYEGDCLPAIVGAYGGAASAFPLALAIALINRRGTRDEAWDSAASGAIVGLAIGWFVVQPIASTLAWQLRKRPSVKAVPPVPAPPPAALAPSPHAPGARADAAMPGQLTFTLFRASF
jgi:hypothetical protein